jgi:hypothetical protein
MSGNSSQPKRWGGIKPKKEYSHLRHSIVKQHLFFWWGEKVDIAIRGKQENGRRHVTYSPRQQIRQDK